MSETGANGAKPSFAWPDLSAYGVCLRMFVRRMDNGGYAKMLSVSGRMTPQMEKALENIGFTKLPWGTFALKNIGDPATFNTRFHNQLGRTFPKATQVAEGQPCFNGTLMRKADVIRDVGNINSLKIFGDPFRDLPPSEFAERSPAPAKAARPPQDNQASSAPQRPSAPPAAPLAAIPPAPAPTDRPPAPPAVSTTQPQPAQQPAQTAPAPTSAPQVTPAAIKPATPPAPPAAPPTPPAPPAPQTPPQPPSPPVASEGLVEKPSSGSRVPPQPATKAQIVREPAGSVVRGEHYLVGGRLTENGKRLQQAFWKWSAEVANYEAETVRRAEAPLLDAWGFCPPDNENNMVHPVYSSFPTKLMGYIDIRTIVPVVGREVRTEDGLYLEARRAGNRVEYILDRGTLPGTDTWPMSGQEIARYISGALSISISQKSNFNFNIEEVWRKVTGANPQESVPPAKARELSDQLCASMPARLVRNAASRRDAYKALEAISGKVLDIAGTKVGLLPHVGFAIARTGDMASIKPEWSVYVNSDPLGLFAMEVPAHSQATYVIGDGGAKTASIITKAIPVGTDKVQVVSGVALPPKRVNFQALSFLDDGPDPANSALATIFDDEVQVSCRQKKALDLLEQRTGDGRSILVIRVGEDEGYNFVSLLSRGWLIDGVAEISASGQGMPSLSDPILAITVGARRPTPISLEDAKPLFSIERIGSAEDLWAWSSATLLKQRENAEISDTFGQDNLIRRTGTNVANAYQTPYASLSQIAEPRTMAPINHGAAQKKAQGRIHSFCTSLGHEGIDQMVGGLLSMNAEALRDNLLPEQVDGIAAGHYRMTRKTLRQEILPPSVPQPPQPLDANDTPPATDDVAADDEGLNETGLDGAAATADADVEADEADQEERDAAEAVYAAVLPWSYSEAVADRTHAQPNPGGDAVLIADNTGVGKTRTNVGMILSRLRNGNAAVYLTEYASSFGAIYLEMVALGGKEVVRPISLNGVPLYDKVTRELLIPATPQHVIAALTSRALPIDYGKDVTCHILTDAARQRLRNEWQYACKNYRKVMAQGSVIETAEMARRFPILISLFERGYYSSGQITLINDETLDLFSPVIEGNDIKETVVINPDYNLVFSSYTQLNTESTLSQIAKKKLFPSVSAQKKRWSSNLIQSRPKVDWMTNVMARHPGLIVVLDECDIAASDQSNISKNVLPLVNHAHDVVYSSANWLKGVKGMGLYRRLLPDSVDFKMVQSLMQRGNEVVNAALTRLLVEMGIYVRRELNMSKCTYSHVVDNNYLERNIALTNILAPVRSMYYIIHGQISANVSLLNEMIENDHAYQELMTGEVRANANGHFMLTGIGSPMARLNSLINNIMLMDATADRAINALKNGEKPFIVVEGTNENFIRGFYEDHGRIPNLRDILEYISTQITKINFNGTEVSAYDENIEMELAHRLADRFLAELPPALKEPLPVNTSRLLVEDRITALTALLQGEGVNTIHDYAMKRIEAIAAAMIADGDELYQTAMPHDYIEAFRVISGSGWLTEHNNWKTLSQSLAHIGSIKDYLPASTMVQMRVLRSLIHDVPEMPLSVIDYIKAKISAAGYSCGEITGRSSMIDGDRVIPRDERDKDTIRVKYNSGEIDAIVVNQASRSSADFHSGANFGDQRPRRTIICGTVSDPATMIQLMGRTMRNGQVNFPAYDFMGTGMPESNRLNSNMGRKLRELLSLSTSDQSNAITLDMAIDMDNVVGNHVCGLILERHPEIRKKIGMEARTQAAASTGQSNEQAETAPDNQDQDNDLLFHSGKYSAATVFNRICATLGYDDQAKIMREITIEYMALIEELDRKSQNPLKTMEIPGESQVISRVVIRQPNIDDGADLEDSVFSQPVYLSKIRNVRRITPVISIHNLVDRIEAMEANGEETPSDRAALIWDRRQDFLRDTMIGLKMDTSIHVDTHFANQESMDVAHRPFLVEYRKLKMLRDALLEIKVGLQMPETALWPSQSNIFNGVARDGKSAFIITNIKMPPPDSMDAGNPQRYTLHTTFPGHDHEYKDRLGVIFTDVKNAIKAENPRKEIFHPTEPRSYFAMPDSGLSGSDPGGFIQAWENASNAYIEDAGRNGVEYNMLTGNILMATSMVLNGKFGNQVVVHTETGPLHGVLITDIKKFQEFNNVIETPLLAKKVLDRIGDLKFTENKKLIHLSTAGKEKKTYYVRLPSKMTIYAVGFPVIRNWLELSGLTESQIIARKEVVKSKRKVSAESEKAPDQEAVSSGRSIGGQTRISREEAELLIDCFFRSGVFAEIQSVDSHKVNTLRSENDPKPEVSGVTEEAEKPQAPAPSMAP